jgi:transposase-like protein
MANRPAQSLILRDGDLPLLTAMTRSLTLRAGPAQRARIVLLAADGLANTAIADKVGVSRPTVLAWRRRYEERGLEGLDDRTRPGRRPGLDRMVLLRATLDGPPRRLGVTHWSSRLLGHELGVGRGTVARGWQQYGLQPVRGGFRYATIPELTGRVQEVLAVRLGPPDNLVLLGVREPSWSRDPSLSGPWANALADLERKLRRAAASPPEDPAESFLRFLDEVHRSRARWPAGADLHLVADGRGPTGLPAVRDALAARSRITVHTTREPERWPDMVEAWLTMVARDGSADETLGELPGLLRARVDSGEVLTWSNPGDRRRPGERSTVKGLR